VKVGFIGAGQMGRPMVARLVEAGHDVSAVGSTADKRRELEQLGAGAVNDLAEAATQADVVLLCVFTDEQVRQVCLDSALLQTMPSGSALVVHTTASPTTIEAIAAAPRMSTWSTHRSAAARTTSRPASSRCSWAAPTTLWRECGRYWAATAIPSCTSGPAGPARRSSC
jgi:hypothetical protein